MQLSKSIVFMMVLFASSVFAAKPAETTKPIRKIVLAIDGLSYNAFKEAQRRGLFAEFKNHGAHIAPFPTMTDLSWATMTKTVDVFGAAGRIKNVEATYFDESTQSIQGDPRDYYQRLAFPKYYLGAFEAVFNPYVEALVYFPTNEVPKMEMKSVVDQVLASRAQSVMLGYVGSVDSTAHTQLNRLFPLLVTVDAEIKRLNKELKNRGEEAEIILVSDHGNVGRFKEGTPESELIGIEISKTIERAGLRFVSQLKDSKDVAMPLLALGTWGPVYFKDRKNKDVLIQALRQETWFDLAMVLNKNNANETVLTVTSANGVASIRLDKKNSLIAYLPQQGNPLQIPAKYHSATGALKPMTMDEAATAALGTPYPDSLFRLAEAASNRNFDFPDMIVTLKDGYFIQNSLGGFTKMYRTHGSLTRASSEGLFASNRRQVPAEIRTRDIFSTLGVDTKDLFKDRARWHNASNKEALAEMAKTHDAGVTTQARDFSEYRIFRLLSRFISDTRSYFLVSEMGAFQKAFKSNPMQAPGGQGLSPMNLDMSQFEMNTMLSPDDIGALTDAVLTSGSVENLMKDPRVEEIKGRISMLKDVKTEKLDAKTSDQGGMLDSISTYLLPTKRSVMKMYQVPFLLQNSLVIQEKPLLPDPRDLLFARDWSAKKEHTIRSFERLNETVPREEITVAQKLFQEVRKEIELEDKVYPTPLAKAFNSKVDDLTVVYVPGIYNSIFDKEIFSLGLQALKDEFGLRVIQPPVESTCSADINGQKILNFMYQDLKDRKERQHKTPRYLFISYSKGAVDTLNFFTKYPGFVSTYVAGMISVSAPLHGASILDKSDLPVALVSALSEGEAPAMCREEKTAASSLTPSAMDAFWRKNERSLIGLTRYFSVTFKSTPEESHLFMRAAKMIAQFDEDNDGVVTVSSSKFPESLKAVDLGTLEADHLAGILSSNFNQKSFMKSLVSTMAELDIMNWQENFKWNTRNIVAAASTPGLLFTKKPSLKGLIYSNSFDLNRQLLPPRNNPADNYETKVKVPSSQFRYDPDMTLDIQKMPDQLAKIRVTPATTQNMPEGIRMEYHHQNMVHFRMDHRFNYESRSPIGMDDNEKTGFIGADFKGQPGWLLMRSVNNSIRLTTTAYRFSPLDFPKTELDLAVTKDVVGADSIKGKTGKDDSPFQVWFTIRVGSANGDRTLIDPSQDKVILFGYYWGSPVAGEVRPAGTIYENWYSNKNVVVATLPEAKQLLLNSPEMLGSAQSYRRNLAQDLAKAFPNYNVADMDILAITLQHDSNDTESSSEAYFKALRFLP